MKTNESRRNTLFIAASAVGVVAIGAAVIGVWNVTANSAAAPAVETSEAGSADGEPARGGELVVALGDVPSNLDLAITPYNNFASRASVDNLFDQDPETGEILPWLATEYEVSDDGLIYTFSLLEGVTFSNGEPFNAHEVKANFDNAIEFRAANGTGVAAGYLTGYTESRVIDDLTLEVTFSQPRADFLQALTEKALGIQWSGRLTLDAEQRAAEGPIGTGAFLISEYIPDERITIVRRDGYDWGSPVNENQGEPYLDSVSFVEIPESGVQVESLLSGEVDAVINPQSADVPRIIAAGGQVVSAISAGVPSTLLPNLEHAPFNDEDVRAAFQIGIDREDIESAINDDRSPAPRSIVSDTLPGVLDLSAELAYDPSAAKKILEDSGWTLGEDGIYQRNGERLTAEITFTSVNERPLWQLLQSQLLDIGFDLQIRQVTSAESTAAQQSGDWDLVSTSFTRADANILLNTFHPDYVSNNRFTRENIGDLVEILDAQAAELDTAVRQELFEDAQRLIIERGYAFPYAQSGRSTAALGGVHGLGNQISGQQVFDQAWKDAG